MDEVLDSGPQPRTTERRFERWEDFQQYAAGFDGPSRRPWDEVWFRGQSNAKWSLTTTLERYSERTRAVVDYLNLICEIQPAIETFTGNQFTMPCQEDLREISGEDNYKFENMLRSCATYLAHLRHGGFPSPLLDWTNSPYVAAYFAFHNARHDGDVAIFAYRESPRMIKIIDSAGPKIVSFGPNFKTHKRHFRQQSRYTACVRFDNERWSFAQHDTIFGQTTQLEQDVLEKVSMPASERLKVLRFCDKVNLNGFTLFDSEEGLLEMQAMRVFDLRPIADLRVGK
jgi:hypothetical protein